MKIFKRSNNSVTHDLLDFPASFSRNRQVNAENQVPARSILNIQTLADQMLLQQFSPAGVLVNENGDIIYISGHTGKYLEPAVGKANMNIFAMLREGIRSEFHVGFRKVIMNKESVVLHNIKVGTNGNTLNLNVNIKWIDKPEPLKGTIMIIFSDVPDIPDTGTEKKKGLKRSNNLRESELEYKLQQTREEMQNTLEEMQTSQEELKSTNEELQSTNEELQSTNEELTTSKEEMQSLNEELQTMNAEMQSKVDEFSRVNNDMKNLLNSTDIATLFLDKELNIRRYTNQATKLFKLIKSDIGRPFTDQVSDLLYPEVTTDALEVLKTLIFIEKQIPAKDNRWYSVRIMPYRTLDDRIDGLVITFINISDHKKLELDLLEKEQFHELLLNSSSEVIIKLSADWKILEFNPEAEKFFGKKRKAAINQNYFQMFVPGPLQKKTENEMNMLLKQGYDGKYKMDVMAAGDKNPVVDWYVTSLLNSEKIPTGMIIIAKQNS